MRTLGRTFSASMGNDMPVEVPAGADIKPDILRKGPRCNVCGVRHQGYETHDWTQVPVIKSGAERHRAWRERHGEQAKARHREYMRKWRAKQKST